MKSKLSFILQLFFFVSCNINNTKNQFEETNQIYVKAEDYAYRNFDSIKICAEKIVHTSNSENKIAKAKSQILLGLYHSKKSNYLLAIKHCENALKLLEEDSSNIKIKADAYLTIGASNKAQSNHELAIYYYLEALKIGEVTNDTLTILKATNSLARINQENDSIEQGFKYVNKAFKLLNNRYQSQYLNTIHIKANLLGMTGQLDSAISIDHLGIAVADSIKTFYFKSPFYDNLANCYKEKKMYDSSLFYFYKTIEIDSIEGNQRLIGDTYFNLANFYFEQKKYIETEKTLNSSLELFRKIDFKKGLALSFDLMAKLKQEQGNLIAAICYKDSTAIMKGKYLNEKSQSKIEELKALFDNEKKETDLQKSAEALKQQRWLIIILIILFTLIITTTTLFLTKRKKEKELTLEKKLIDLQQQATANIFKGEQKERIRLAQDLHDTIGQKLTALKMYSSALEIKNETYNKMLTETINEVRVVSHNIMPEIISLGLITALKDICDKVNLSKNIKCVLIHDTKSNVDFGKAINNSIYKIIQEITSNMIKHSKADLIEIVIIKKEKETTFTIKDNGVGFDTGLISTTHGLGWQNIIARVKLINGTINILSNNNGTIITFAITNGATN